MIPAMFPEDVLRVDLARTLRKIRRARLFGDLGARLVQLGRAAAVNRELRRRRKLGKRHEGNVAA